MNRGRTRALNTFSWKGRWSGFLWVVKAEGSLRHHLGLGIWGTCRSALPAHSTFYTHFLLPRAPYCHLRSFWFGPVLPFAHLALFCLGSYKQAQIKNKALDMENVLGTFLGDRGTRDSSEEEHILLGREMARKGPIHIPTDLNPSGSREGSEQGEGRKM